DVLRPGKEAYEHDDCRNDRAQQPAAQLDQMRDECFLSVLGRRGWFAHGGRKRARGATAIVTRCEQRPLMVRCARSRAKMLAPVRLPSQAMPARHSEAAPPPLL